MPLSRGCFRSTLALALVCSALTPLQAGAQSAAAQGPVTQERLLDGEQAQGNWLLHHGDYAAHRYSPLTQVTRDNVKDLKVAWTMALGGVESGGIWSHGGLEGTPIAEGGFLYVTDGWGSVYKIDAHGGQGKLVWKMAPRPIGNGPAPSPAAVSTIAAWPSGRTR